VGVHALENVFSVDLQEGVHENGFVHAPGSLVGWILCPIVFSIIIVQIEV
jgi:hypothetical protein